MTKSGGKLRSLSKGLDTYIRWAARTNHTDTLAAIIKQFTTIYSDHVEGSTFDFGPVGGTC